jgi:hypothetical protein
MAETEWGAKVEKEIRLLKSQINSLQASLQRNLRTTTHPSALSIIKSQAGDLLGTTNQVIVDNGEDSILKREDVTLSLPQDIHNGATPTFVSTKLSALTPGRIVFVTTNDLLTDSSVLAFDGTYLLTTIPFGSMYGDNIAQNVSITVVDTFVRIGGGISSGTCAGFTFQNDRELKCDIAGKYFITWSISAKTSAVANKEVEGAIMIGGVASTVGTAHAEVSPGGSNRPETISGNGVFTLAVDDLVSLAVANRTDTTDIVVEHVSLTAIRLTS